MVALGCAILVPASFRLGQQIMANYGRPFNLKLQYVPSSVLIVTVGLWIFSIITFIV
jgi:hypothetical protein